MKLNRVPAIPKDHIGNINVHMARMRASIELDILKMSEKPNHLTKLIGQPELKRYLRLIGKK